MRLALRALWRDATQCASKRAARRAKGYIGCQTLPGLPRAARPSGRFAEGKTPQRSQHETIYWFSCVAAARAACVSTWLGELSLASLRTKSKLKINGLTLTDDIRLPFWREKRKLRAARGSDITATRLTSSINVNFNQELEGSCSCIVGLKPDNQTTYRHRFARAAPAPRAKNCKLITYWPARSMLTHFRCRRASPVKQRIVMDGGRASPVKKARVRAQQGSLHALTK